MEATIDSTDMLKDLGADGCVRKHCQLKGLLPVLANVIRLAKDSFSPAPRISLSLSVEPDGGPERLVVDFKVMCSVDEAAAAYDAFLPRWIASATRGERANVILVYTVA
jgi:hypothetical protein